jgi:membrane protein
MRSTVDAFTDDELLTRAAALSFYAALSMAPLLLLLVWTVSIIQPGWVGGVTQMLAAVVGERGAGAINDVLDAVKGRTLSGNVTSIVSIGITLFSATAVFAQLQGTLNRVWRVKPRPGAAIGAWLRARAHAVGVLAGLGFLLVISFVISTAIRSAIPNEGMVWSVLGAITALIVMFVAFCAIYKVLPDALVEWSDVMLGAAITSLLLQLGRYAIDFYLIRAQVGSAYGSAAGIVVLLTWMYYSAVVVLTGASLTRALADAYGKPIRPSEHAVEFLPGDIDVPRDDDRDDPANRS